MGTSFSILVAIAKASGGLNVFDSKQTESLLILFVSLFFVLKYLKFSSAFLPIFQRRRLSEVILRISLYAKFSAVKWFQKDFF